MKYRIRSQKDVAAGLLYVAFGAAFSIGALNYKLGDPARMGPGWFPFWIGVLLALVGVATAAAGFARSSREDKVEVPRLRALAWIIGGVVLFGVVLLPLGMVGSLTLLVIVSSFASHEFSWKGAIAAAVVLVAFSTGVFIKGINLQIPMWPVFLR